jgi:hypothetical protein
MFHTNPNVTSPLHLVDNMPAIWDALNETLEAVRPEKIAVNVSSRLCPIQ